MNLAQNSNSTHVLYIVQPSSAEPTEVMDKHMDMDVCIKAIAIVAFWQCQSITLPALQ